MFAANITRAEAQLRSTQVAAGAYQVLVDITGRGADGAPLHHVDGKDFTCPQDDGSLPHRQDARAALRPCPGDTRTGR